ITRPDVPSLSRNEEGIGRKSPRIGDVGSEEVAKIAMEFPANGNSPDGDFNSSGMWIMPLWFASLWDIG
ncbi:MAG TPA: hypothetical protein PL001_12440, partial [Candidatus Kryptobacter bacterium]|nr:hypothetical protein [Candidatus Kryptobacter bacterium]